MTTLNLEPQELSIIIRALEMLKTVHPCALCDYTLTPVLEKLRKPPELEPAAPIPVKMAKLAARPTAWTELEDAVIRRYSSMGQPVWPSMQAELPGRTLNMIKARFGRLELIKAAAEPPHEHESEAAPENPRATESMDPAKLELPPEPVPPPQVPASEPEPSAPVSPSQPILATTQSTAEWSLRPPSLAELMSGKR